MTASKLAVLGAGSWGTALANLLCLNGHEVTLWGRNKDQIQDLQKTFENAKYLPGIKLTSNLKFSDNLITTISNVDGIVVVTPSHIFREMAKQLKGNIAPSTIVILACKGFEEKTGLLLHDVFQQELKDQPLAVLSGPTFAKEVLQGLPTAVTIACVNAEQGNKVVDWFHNQSFRPYYNSDVIGVELGGAIKNVLAIAAGIADGLKLGANTRAALISRGMSEIIQLGLKMGAKENTLMGLAGLGDLVLTCTDDLSRNRQLGLLLAKGLSLQEAKIKVGQEVEGIRAAKVANELSKKYQVETPIVNSVYQVLLNQLKPIEAVSSLMSRDVKKER